MGTSEAAGTATQGSIDHAAAMVAHIDVLPGSQPWLRLARLAKFLRWHPGAAPAAHYNMIVKTPNYTHV